MGRYWVKVKCGKMTWFRMVTILGDNFVLWTTADHMKTVHDLCGVGYIWIRSRKIWINKQCGVNMRFEMKEGGTQPQRHSPKTKKWIRKYFFPYSNNLKIYTTLVTTTFVYLIGLLPPREPRIGRARTINHIDCIIQWHFGVVWRDRNWALQTDFYQTRIT